MDVAFDCRLTFDQLARRILSIAYKNSKFMTRIARDFNDIEFLYMQC